MINKKEFNGIRKEFEKFESKREQLIQTAREIIKLSKLIIYSLHRNESKKAEVYVKTIKKEIKKLPRESYDTAMHRTANQEYAEALCFYEFKVHKRLPTSKQLGIKSEDYLLGLCDLTGELVRDAVNEAIRKQHKAVREIHKFVDEIYGEFLKFNLRNSELRKKADSIKWNLKKLDEIVLGIGK
ncbi:hypothetical protein HZB88_03470 [archaeon]|nr:hypothetical protein [archaeon]